MARMKSGGGWAAIVYTVVKSVRAVGGPLGFWRRMASRNACKTCALGMGGQRGGMRNEAGHFPEFCKKSVQAMAADLQPPLAPDFFLRHSREDLSRLSSRELENLGRLAYPVVGEHGARHFRRIGWEEALDRVALEMRRTEPGRSFFYSSGRSSNEAAFLLQWLARIYGTNNVNNCSYYCHQASGVALGMSLASATASVTLADLDGCDFAMVLGANPASNHPRLITKLAGIRRRGGQVVIVNPLREPGLDRFKIPSQPLSLLLGSRVNDLYLQPRIGGDIALLKGMLKVLIAEDRIERGFIERHTTGFAEVRDRLAEESLDDLAANAGVARPVIVEVARRYGASRRAIFMWAMGITHHEHGVDNVLAIVNLALARGMVGRRHAGLMPIRGHSNIQGIGSVGFAPELKAGMLAALEQCYGLKAPTAAGLDSMGSLQAAHRGAIDFALLLGGNFYSANPDQAYAREAFSRILTTVHVSTKLNAGHVDYQPSRPGATVFILPTCVREEELQATTQESMFSFVRLSEGGMSRPSSNLKSEVEIVTGLGARLLPRGGPIDFARLANHDEIRAAMGRVVPGYAQVTDLARTRAEFHVEGRVRHEPRFPTADGRARFHAVATPADALTAGELRLMTIRSEGQFNTVVYEEHDRYRNQPSRDVILVHPEDLSPLGLREGDRVTVISATGALPGIRVAAFAIARGCAAMYYPEANVLVGRSVDAKCGTPAFKHVRVRLEREAPAARSRTDGGFRSAEFSGQPGR